MPNPKKISEFVAFPEIPEIMSARHFYGNAISLAMGYEVPDEHYSFDIEY